VGKPLVPIPTGSPAVTSSTPTPPWAAPSSRNTSISPTPTTSRPTTPSATPTQPTTTTPAPTTPAPTTPRQPRREHARTKHDPVDPYDHTIAVEPDRIAHPESVTRPDAKSHRTHCDGDVTDWLSRFGERL